MSTRNYPNRNALRDANDIYLDTMRAFIIYHLKQVQGETVEHLIENVLKDEQADEFWRILDETDDIASAIDFSYFPLIIKGQWSYVFAQRFNMDLTVQSMLWLIRKGRNSCEHRGATDLDLEFVRMNLSLIADVLGKISRPDKQREVEIIRDELDDTAEQLATTSKKLEVAVSENAKYKRSLAEAEKHLKVVESEKNDYEDQLETTSKGLETAELERDDYSEQLKVKLKELEDTEGEWNASEERLAAARSEKDDYKERLTTTSRELEGVKTKWGAAEDRFAAASNELAAVQAAKNASEERLTAVWNLLATATLENPENRSIFPALDTDSPVRILDRRGRNKKDYLRKLLDQKQPSIIYVQSEEKVEELLTSVLPEKADVIEKLYETTPEEKEKEILEKLENGELIAVVSSSTVSTLSESHCVKHFIFCHLSPDLDAFFERCRPVFTSTKDGYLHFIYESKQDIEELAEKYPDEEALRKLYEKFKDRTPINGEFIDPDNLHSELCKENELDMTTLGIKTGFSIFKELGFLEQNGKGIKRLSTTRTRLEGSETYCRGKQFREEAENSPAFQYEQSIEQIWESILEKVNVGNEFILRENNISTELKEVTVESLIESVEGISETAASEFVTTLEPPGALSQAREPRLSIADRYVAETTEADRDKLAVQIAALRINATGSRPLAWKDIRAEFGLKNDEFHEVIRPSPGYRKAVIDRIKSLKAQEGGWEYSGKLKSLTGIDDISEDELK